MRANLRPVLRAFGFLLAASLLAACGGEAQPVIVTALPTETNTPAPSPTEAPVAALPTDTPSPTRPVITRTPGTPAGFPLVPTVSPAPETLTATVAPTRFATAIEYFTTDSEFVTPGENVTLFWSVEGVDRARIFRVDETGERLSRWDVMGEGQLTVATRPQDRDVARFLLTAQIGATEIEQLLQIRCAAWICGSLTRRRMPAQPHRRDHHAGRADLRARRMVWVECWTGCTLSSKTVATGCGDVSRRVQRGRPGARRVAVPPPGLEQPIRGFGLVWRSNPRVQDRLGWATSPEVPFEGMMQSDSADLGLGTLYLRLRDGGILALDARTNEWDVLVATGDSASP